jgi:hypothetical protein
VLRLFRLGQWGFEGDEIFTLKDSLHINPSNPRPLLYLLNHYVIASFHPLDELGMRIFPALFGILAIPTLYWVGKRLLGNRAAMFAALLLTLNPMHLYHSQYARYWSLVFLLSAIYPYALYWGVREHNRRWLIFGLITGVLAVLAHPVALLPFAGLLLGALFHVRRDLLPKLWSRPLTRWVIILGGILVILAAVRSASLLHEWVGSHDVKTRVPDRLFSRRPIGLKQLAILAAFVDDLTLPVAVLGAVGLYVLWRWRNRPVGTLLACLLVVPVLTILVISSRTPVSPNYLIMASPVVFLAAGKMLDELSRVELGLQPRWIVPATLTIISISAGLPSLISQYRDGTRYDFRAAARWLARHQSQDDAVFSDEFRVVAHYLPASDVEHLAADTVELARAVRALPDSGRARAVWIVAPAPSHPFRTSLSLHGLIGWVYANCQLRTSLGVGRLDLRQNYLQIFRCPPLVEQPAESGPALGQAAGPRMNLPGFTGRDLAGTAQTSLTSNVAIQGFPAIHHSLETVFAPHILAPQFSHGAALLIGKIHQPQHRGG